VGRGGDAERGPLLRRGGGAILILSGLVADGFAAWFFLTEGIVEGCLVHLHAVLCWTLGLALLLPSRERGAEQPVRRATSRGGRGSVVAARSKTADEKSLALLPGIDGRLVAAFVLALALFPLAGMLGWGLAFVLTPLLRGQGTAENDLAELEAEAWRDDPVLVRQIEPLVDRLRDPDLDQRRAVIAALGRNATGDAVRLLRGLLNDPHPDMRSDASVMLARIEDRLERRVEQGMERVEELPGDADAHADLASAYATYARSGLLDEASARYALGQAEAALGHAAARSPEGTERWLALARIRRELGDTEGALQALHEVALREPTNPERMLLNMEIAFDRRDWSELATLAGQGELLAAEGAEPAAAGSLDADPEAHSAEAQAALIGWWAGERAARPVR
jgi:hypothetical protein